MLSAGGGPHGNSTKVSFAVDDERPGGGPTPLNPQPLDIQRPTPLNDFGNQPAPLHQAIDTRNIADRANQAMVQAVANQGTVALVPGAVAMHPGALERSMTGTLSEYGFTQPPEPPKLEKVEGPLKQTLVDGHVGFVEVSFSRGEQPIGLIFDWSLPFPMIARVAQGGAAEKKPQLSPGLVLIAVNGEGVRIREEEDQVADRLQVRPLHLIFEAPAPERFDFFGTMKSWKKTLNKMRAKPPLSSVSMLGKPQTQNLSLTSSRFFFDRYSDRRVDEEQVALLPKPPPASSLGRSLRRVSSVPRALNSFDDMHGSRVADIRELHSQTKLPPVIRGGSSFSSSAPSFMLDRTRPRTGVSWAGHAAAVAAASPLRQAVSSKSLTWLGTETPRPDPAYQHLIDDPRIVGPGPPDRWPLLHDEMYLCRLSDMHLAWRTREAYEVGFRGKKFERTTQMHLTCAKGAPPLKKAVAKLDEIYCDLCGSDIIAQERDLDKEKSTHASPLVLPPAMVKSIEAIKAEAEAKKAKQLYPDEVVNLVGSMAQQTQGAFYYCRRCKRNGHRFELCAACHGIEVIQGEGKHHGKTLHPHFLRCQHRSLVRRRFVNDVCPGMPHIRRVMCDYCGHLAGSFDDDSEVWICERCPEEHGLRFEICVPCYTSMMTVSDGLDRIHALRTSLL